MNLLFIVVSAGPWASRRPCFTSGSFERSSRVSGCASASSCAVSDRCGTTSRTACEKPAPAAEPNALLLLRSWSCAIVSVRFRREKTYGLRGQASVLRNVGRRQVGLSLGGHVASGREARA